MLVLPSDLEEVEEVGAAGVDLDEVFGRIGLERWQGLYFKVEGSGDVRRHLYGSHRDQCLGACTIQAG